MTNNLAGYIERELSMRGWSVRELARRSELSAGGISDVMNDRANPGVEFCKGISRALGVAPEYVFRLAGILPRRDKDAELTDEILHYFDQLEHTDKLRLITVAWSFTQRGKGT